MGKAGLVAKPIAKARTRHPLAPSRISAPLVWFGRFLIAPYLRTALSFRKIEMRHPEGLLRALQDFQEKRNRLIVAFRHPYGDEPQLLFHVTENLIPRLAKSHGVPLAYKPHLRIVHGYEVPLWGGAFLRFILPRVGALPVYHARFDAESLMNIRKILSNDRHPLALAPEGQVSYHSETLPRIEQGTVHMGFWCAKDLEKAGRPERVLVLPLSVHYQYDTRDLGKLLRVVSRIEALCGIEPASAPAHDFHASLAFIHARLEPIENRMLEITEAFYRETYGYRPQEEGGGSLRSRWEALQDFALGVAEHALGIAAGHGDRVQRMYRIRLEGWDRIFPKEQAGRPSALEAGLAHRRAGEAWFAMRHMEFVDLMDYHDEDYLRGGADGKPNFDRTVEAVWNLADLASRLRGGNISNRPNAIRKSAVLVPGSPLDLTARLPEYNRNNRRAVCDATEALAGAFRKCIEEYRNAE